MSNQKTNCLICNHEFDYKKLPSIQVSKQYKYSICSNCSGAILTPMPSQRELSSHYKSQKYYEGLSKEASNPFVQWLITRKLYKEPYEWVVNNFDRGKILDVGCGNGEFLNNLQDSKWKVWGSDISRLAKQNTEIKIGKDKVKLGYFPKQKIDETFNYISFWHVLEHVENPTGYLSKAWSMLEKNGKVLGEVPNFDSLAFSVFKRNYAWIMVPVHITYFSRKSLKNLLEECDYSNVIIYSPPRALLNFSLSLNNVLRDSNPIIRKLLFMFSIPFSALLIMISSLFNRGEVLRFVAEKKNNND